MLETEKGKRKTEKVESCPLAGLYAVELETGGYNRLTNQLTYQSKQEI